MTAPTPDQLREWQAVTDAATAGPWTPGHNPPDREPIAYIAEAYSYGPPGTMHLVCVPFEDKPMDEEALFTAITGNGPTSEANARFIALARTAMPLLLAEVARLREREAQLQDQVLDVLDSRIQLRSERDQARADLARVTAERDEARARLATARESTEWPGVLFIDAQTCPECGSIMVRNGDGHVCANCFAPAPVEGHEQEKK
jgi:hypothetical protein